MARSSDTRGKVRAAAEALAEAGDSITSRKIRDILGAGSLSTITDELSKWESERKLGAEPTSLDVPERPAPVASDVAPRPVLKSEVEPALGEEVRQIGVRVEGLLERVQTELAAVRGELAANRKSYEEQLALAYHRYEAVQRHAMVQIDDARQAAAELRRQLSSVTLDSETREDAQRGKAQALREENVRLLAQLEVFKVLVLQKGDQMSR